MDRLAALLLLVSLALLAVTGITDRTLSARAADEEARARAGVEEHARLQALAVRAALAQVEEGVGSGAVAPGVTRESLSLPPARHAPGWPVPYTSLDRQELAKRLASRAATTQGLPEAVVAAIAFGTADAKSEAAGRLFAGDLPVSPDDVDVLAEALGFGSDPRKADLSARLAAAPDPTSLPRLPAFLRRRLPDGNVEGWSVDESRWVHYRLPAERLLELARADATVDQGGAPAPRGPAPGAAAVKVSVPDVEGFSLWVSPPMPSRLRVLGLRIFLWSASAATMIALAATARAIRSEARAVAREKAFLASVTHELRTPLASIRILGETLAEGRGDPADYGRLVARESERLEELLEQVLAATRALEAPRFTPVSPGEIARSALGLVEPRARRRSVSMSLHVPEGIREATWDGDAVRRALLNLLDNAIRHGGEAGRVSLTLREDGDAVALEVQDDGPGIGRRERGRIFERFGRGSTSAPGTGLGLYLVDQVARSHGGRVDLSTAEGRGCTFTMVLPLRPPASVGGEASS